MAGGMFGRKAENKLRITDVMIGLRLLRKVEAVKLPSREYVCELACFNTLKPLVVVDALGLVFRFAGDVDAQLLKDVTVDAGEDDGRMHFAIGQFG